ncbi:MAG: DUF1538 domain-containing protein [Pirellulaceae bacterium]|nr:DUF1538 domain-containing protein [Pirellulaceae bacterium]
MDLILRSIHWLCSPSGLTATLYDVPEQTETPITTTGGFSEMVWALVYCLFSTIWNVLPIAVVVIVFQLLVLRRPLQNLPRLIWGFCFVILGLTFFLVGLEFALFPLGEEMARQLTSPEFLGLPTMLGSTAVVESIPWQRFYWTYLFAFFIGFSTTVAEPSLIAVAMKAEEVSGGAVKARGLRMAVALGVGVGITLGTFRIVVGQPLAAYIIPGYIFVMIQTYLAPRAIVPLAYDSGGVTTSTVTVPLVTALGLGLSTQIPGRNPLLDGFGLIAFASLFPIISVLGYAQAGQWLERRRQAKMKRDEISNSTLDSENTAKTHADVSTSTTSIQQETITISKERP